MAHEGAAPLKLRSVGRTETQQANLHAWKWSSSSSETFERSKRSPTVTESKILDRLNRLYGKGNWRKLKGIAPVRLSDGTIAEAEIHWFEAHGIGKRRMKIKRLIG